MNTAPLCLDRYLKAPKAAIELPRFPEAAAECFAPFLSGGRSMALLKWLAVKRTARALIKTGCMDSFTVHLLWSRKTVAYMHDEGRIYLSVGLLQNSSAMTVLSVYCHELSHVKLSQRADYGAIKALQRSFRQQFGHHSQCELLSPIEYYAMLISQALLEALAEHTQQPVRKQLLQLQTDIEEKLRYLDGELSRLAQNDVI